MKDVVRLLQELVDIGQELLTIARTKSHEVATGAVPDADVATDSGQVEPELIEVTGAEAPWYLKAMEFLGLDEAEDQEELEDFLGINPNEKTGGQPWCAYFIVAVFGAIGIKWGQSGRAVDHAEYGYKIDEPIDGAIVIFEGGFLSGGHIAIVCEGGTKMLGGNQRNMVKLNNLAYYIANSNLVGYYVPHGYKLVA